MLLTSNRWLIGLFMLFVVGQTQAQIVYSIKLQNGVFTMVAIDLSTCEYCEIGPANGFYSDMVLYPNGSYAQVGSLVNPPRGVIYTFTAPNYTMSTFTGPVGSQFDGAVYGANGLVYINGTTGGQPALFSFNPVTQQLIFIGNLPVLISDIYFLNGQLYGISHSSPPAIWQIDISNPSQSVHVQDLPIYYIPGVFSVGASVFMGIGSTVYQYDVANNSLEPLCTFNNPIISPYQIASAAPGGVEPDCFCDTDAGTFQAYNIQICGDQDATANHLGDHVLDADDILRFILFSNPANPMGSSIQTSTSPTFPFAAPLQAGVTYYIAAIAGNNVNGNVDPNDPCFSISDFVAVVWHPLPTVVLTASQTDVCTGDCRMIDVVFTGTAPFALTYTANGGNPVTQTFSSNTGTLQVCPPPGTPPGSFTVQATALTDAYCTCN